MYFFNPQHQEAFHALVAKYKKSSDNEYMSAFYILSTDTEIRHKTDKHVTYTGIDWEGIWQYDWSSGYRLILELGETLFKSSGSFELAQGLNTWDEYRFEVAMQAIRIRKNGLTSAKIVI